MEPVKVENEADYLCIDNDVIFKSVSLFGFIDDLGFENSSDIIF